MKTYSVQEAAALLKVSAGTIYGLCSRRRLRHERIGLGRGIIRIPEDAIGEYRLSRTVPAETVGQAAPPAPKPKPIKLQHLRLKPS